MSATSPEYSIVVPTDGSSAYLIPTLFGAPEAVARIVVWTADSDPDPRLPPGTAVIRDDGPMNIQQWWLRGIAAAPTDVCVIINDDVEAPPGSLAELAASLAPSGATLAMLANYRLTGWCFALNRAHGVLPDPGYTWYFGDNDLLRRASVPPGRGAVRPDVPAIVHRRFRTTDRRKDMRDQFRTDRARFLAAGQEAVLR
jgi:hypothetical protein